MFGLQSKVNEQSGVERETTYMPAVDVTENENGYTIYADVPGVDKNSAEVTYEDGIVTLKAHSNQKSESQVDAKRIHREFRYAAYERAFKVGDDVDTEAITAEIANGELKVFLPRKASAKRTISISAK
jgi:HSP20 family protein